MNREIQQLNEPGFEIFEVDSPNVYASITNVNTGIIYMKSLTAQVVCKQCQRNFTINRSKQCQCKNDLIYEFTPIFYHNNYVGRLEMSSLVLICFETPETILSCLNCGSYYHTKEKNVEFSCFNCNTFTKYKLNKVWLKPSRKEQNKEFVPVKGTPLPNNGACKHYRKSFKWYRFPCCNKLFPCDECHNESVDHELKRASKMICGLCAEEQNIAKRV
ncbi:Zn-finger protein [Trachipleistophora hominis]|uniref:Zn-finger protein n=1 Tax=Trachipleistophora hominis TaxID=72359 RepID=L7JTB8_TRAHO|nr:Zn-finger protein [Trachipleistophora hominis]